MNPSVARRVDLRQEYRHVAGQRQSPIPMMHPTPKQVSWLLVDLCEKVGFSMAIRDEERFQKVALQGPDAFTDAVLAAEGLTPNEEKQMRRALNVFVSARFAQWDAEGGDDRIRLMPDPQPTSESNKFQ